MSIYILSLSTLLVDEKTVVETENKPVWFVICLGRCDSLSCDIFDRLNLIIMAGQ